jgi:hypothetical protein
VGVFHLGELGVDLRIILKFTLKVGCEVVDWFHLIQNGVQWLDFVNTIMNIGVP